MYHGNATDLILQGPTPQKWSQSSVDHSEKLALKGLIYRKLCSSATVS